MSSSAFTPKPSPAADRLTYDTESGVILDDQRERVIWVPEDLVQSIHAVIRRRMPDVAAQTLYRFGRLWGERFFVQVTDRIAATASKTGTSDLSSRAFFSRCDEVWGEWGWGHFEVVELGAATLINLYNSPIALSLGNSSEAVDDLFAGMFAGLFSKRSGATAESVEIACLAKGAPYCRFIVGDEAIVRKVYAWAAYGTATDDIVRRLSRNGE